jgi:hypothetical protein
MQKQKIKVELSEKQLEALNILKDKITTELFYGGGAGGGKSFLGCFWLVSSCLLYPGTRWLMGRAILKALKESTLHTFFAVCRLFRLKPFKDYKYNSIEGRITFMNESEVYLKDLFAYPSDPEFDSLGSTEYTGAFIDEVSEITEKAKEIVMSRLRYKLDEYNLIPKLLMASNPAKNFAFKDYWKPWKDGKLPKYRKFVPALVDDNPYMSPFYKENLQKLSKNSKERLLHGNWYYDDDPFRLFDYDKILQMFENSYEARSAHQKYLSVDVARFGDDKTVIIQWLHYHIEKIYVLEKKDTKFTSNVIKTISYQQRIPRSNIVIDDDGLGGGVVDNVEGCKGFVNNARPIERKQTQSAYHMPPIHNFANLKTQCYFLLSEKFVEGEISCSEIDEKIKEMLLEDLQQIKVKDYDKDTKVRILSKEEIKENLGRSPDFSDAMMMRLYFDLKPEYKPYFAK